MLDSRGSLELDWPDRSKALRRPPTIRQQCGSRGVGLKVTGAPQGQELFARAPIHRDPCQFPRCGTQPLQSRQPCDSLISIVSPTLSSGFLPFGTRVTFARFPSTDVLTRPRGERSRDDEKHLPFRGDEELFCLTSGVRSFPRDVWSRTGSRADND